MSQSTSGESRKRRADADRSVAAILDAAIEALAGDLEASMAEIARRAGVARATIYVPFPTRDALIDAVTEKGVREATAVIAAAHPDQGDPVDALCRVVAAGWQSLGRFHALVAINMRRPQSGLHDVHRPVLALLQPLVERGQADGAFRADVPVSWHVSAVLALIHSASGQVRDGGMTPEAVETALIGTIAGAVLSADHVRDGIRGIGRRVV